jgi:hypothetical protein
MVAENKEKIRMNQHFQQKDTDKLSRREKSASKNIVDKRENLNEKMKSFERDSEEEDE